MYIYVGHVIKIYYMQFKRLYTSKTAMTITGFQMLYHPQHCFLISEIQDFIPPKAVHYQSVSVVAAAAHIFLLEK